MKILTIIGARPQFIKASVVSQAINQHSDFQEIIVHTGQHFDPNMSGIFFEQLNIPRPNYLLDIHGGSHGQMTGRMLEEIEKIILYESPDRVIVYGDTNSTLAGALAAAKLHIPVAHIEAGLRSFNMAMPEEINRILTDQISDILFCPTQTAIENLKQEGFAQKSVHLLNVGDVMQDSALLFAKHALPPEHVTLPKVYLLATLHRAENTDDAAKLTEIVDALNHIHNHITPIVLPLHPRTKAAVARLNLRLNVQIIEPVGYLQMLWLLKYSQLVLTDSGGLQKEAFFFAKPCVTLREQTEWVELTDNGVNKLVGTDKELIVTTVNNMMEMTIEDPDNLYGGGTASMRIVQELMRLAI